MISEEAWGECLLLLRVAPPLMFTFVVISGHAHKQLSCTKPLPRGISVLIWGLFASKISWLFLHHNILFHLIQPFIHGNSQYRFPKRWNWQICHAHRAFQLPLHTLSSKLRTFPTVKSKTIGFLLDRIQQYTPVHFGKSPHELLPEKEPLSGHYAAYSEVTACATLHGARDFTMFALKIGRSTWQNDFYSYRRASHTTL